MSAVWTSVVAAGAALAGGWLSSTQHVRLARANRREARQGRALTAVTELAAALAAHRRAMWVTEDRRLSGGTEEAVREAQATSHDTRTAIEMPLQTVAILVPSLARPAENAKQATFAMRNAADREALEALRQAAVDDHGQFVAAARRVFADMATTVSKAVAP